MADQQDVRRIALSLPDTAESEDRFAFSVRAGAKWKRFAWEWRERTAPGRARVPNPGVLVVRVDGAVAKKELLAADPVKFFTEPHYNGYPAVLVRLAEVGADELAELLTDAWRVQAPRRLAAAFDAGPGAGRAQPDSPDGLPVIPFADPAALESWLEDHHGLRSGIWVKVAKKATGLPSVTHPEIVEAALCFGWIDGRRRGLDDTHFLQKITPRRPRSTWSPANVRTAEALTAAGRMREPGLAEVRAAQADGRWAAAHPARKDAEAPPEAAGGEG